MKKEIPANFNSLCGNVTPENAPEEYFIYRKSWIENPKNFILKDFPLHLDIESTNMCNLRCAFCDKLPNIKKDRLGMMDFDLYKKIIDEGRENHLWGIKLSYRGEPLLHKKLPEMVAYAKSKGVLDIYFNTNGMLLTEQVCHDLIEAGLDRVSFSIEGTDAEEFERVRIGAKFDIVRNNIKMLRDIRDNLKLPYPKIRVQSVWLPDLDVDGYKNFWSECADEVAVIDFKDESVRKKGIEAPGWACPQLWQRLTIEWDGTIFGCNNDDLRAIELGNVRERTIADCWHDERLMEVRKLHVSGKSHLARGCDGCPWRQTQLIK